LPFHATENSARVGFNRSSEDLQLDIEEEPWLKNFIYNPTKNYRNGKEDLQPRAYKYENLKGSDPVF
jgi:hypothetical protein